MKWNSLRIPKLQRLHRWSLGMDKQFHPTFYWASHYLSILWLKLIHVSKRAYSFLYPLSVINIYKFKEKFVHVSCILIFS